MDLRAAIGGKERRVAGEPEGDELPAVPERGRGGRLPAGGAAPLRTEIVYDEIPFRHPVGGRLLPEGPLRAPHPPLPPPAHGGTASAPSRKYLGIRAPLHPLPLRCASSPYSTVCLSRAPCWRGASTLSVHQAIYETVHYSSASIRMLFFLPRRS